MAGFRISGVTKNAAMQEIRAKGDCENIRFQITCRQSGESIRISTL